MKIVDVYLSPGYTGFYYDDQEAIKKGLKQDGFTYPGHPVTQNFKEVRQAGESISVMIVLEDGQVAIGDCVTVQYSGIGGRDSLFLAKDFIPIIEKHVSPKLIGKNITSFKEMAHFVENIRINNRKLHSAIRYGVTQSILSAVSLIQKKTMAEVIKEEYNIKGEFTKIPIDAQTGDERYINVDKMILKEIDSLPHGLLNNIKQKIGKNGEKLKDYVKWVRDRILKLRTSTNYNPSLLFDVYGALSTIFRNEIDSIVEYMGELEKLADPFKLRLESPIDGGSRDKQIELLKTLRLKLKENNIHVEIIADEWCNTLEDIKLFVDQKAVDMVQIKSPDLGSLHNTIEALLYCKKNEIGAYCGGSCNETDISAQITTNIAIACGADLCQAKPGMGVDEGFMIVYNEMNRTLTLSNKN